VPTCDDLMMSPDELLSWYQRLEVSEAARAEIDRIRSSCPSRRVGGGKSNVSGRYPSRKMGATIQFESHQVELAFVREMEHDPDVLEFYDQPPSIPLDHASAYARSSLIRLGDFAEPLRRRAVAVLR
jgi:putative transposase